MEPFKNAISPDLIKLTARLLSRAVPSVDPAEFAAPLLDQLDPLELKQRVVLIADALHAALPQDPARRRDALLSMLHPDGEQSWNADSSETGLCGWGIWPLTTVIGTYGLGSTQMALETLREMTKRGTSEFDVRPFITHEPDIALSIVASWVSDPNHHVRRLVSEGTRPRLPWGMRLHGLVADPGPMLPVLTQLRDDPSEYVRRSVANHLNDIAKDHPDLVADLASQWMQDADENRVKLLRHACRTLIKQGHPGAMAAFGFHTPKLKLTTFSLASDRVRFGNDLTFEAVLHSTAATSQDLVIDYVIHHQKADGSLSPKVFKWTKVTLCAGETRAIQRSHKFKPITTRRYYPGPHAVGLRINGSDYDLAHFNLEMADALV